MPKFDKKFWTIPGLTEGFYIEQVQQYIKEHIANGVLKPNDLIPPYRLLGDWNHLHRNTVNYIYHQLQREGWVYGRPGHGTFISETFPGYENLYQPSRTIGELPIKLNIAERFRIDARLPLPSFTTIGFDTPSPHYFPVWHHYNSMNTHVKDYRQLNQMDRVIDLQGLEFKDAIYKHLDIMRQFSIRPNNVDVIMGRQQCLERILKTLLQPGDQVINTSPKDTMLCGVFNDCTVQCHELNYFEPDFIEKLTLFLSHTQIKALYLRPQCSYPESHFLKPKECLAVINLAKKHDFYILEEDDYHEFWYGKKAFKELIRFDHGGHVIYLGALSQLTTYMQQTRTIVAAPEFIDLMKTIPVWQFDFRDILEERVITDLLNSKKIYKYISTMKIDKAKHFEHIWLEMDNYLRQGVKIIKPSSGLILWLEFPDDVSLLESMELILKSGQQIPYHPDGLPPGPGIRYIRLGFGSWEILEAQNAAKLLQEKFIRDYGNR
jgi:GntR family transcriptional regulator/MocR family aminotransferase